MVMPSSLPPVPRLLRGSVVVRRRRGAPDEELADAHSGAWNTLEAACEEDSAALRL